MFPSRPKLIHITTVGTTALRLLLPQCTYFRQQGMDVSFVFSPGPEAALLREKGFHVNEIYIDRKINLLNDIQSIWQLKKYFQKVKPHIVHTHTSKAGIAGRVAARLAKVPVIIHTVHGFPFHDGMPLRQIKLYQAIERFGAKLSTAILSQSREDVEAARSLGIKSKTGELIHIGNGIDINRFRKDRFTESQRLKIKKRLGLSPETFVLTTIARINPLKGYVDLIDAVAQLPGENWQLLCIGEDEGQLGEILSKIRQLGLENKVSMLGPRNDIPEILSITDIYILASYREGIPRSVIEAQAMEIPAVVTNVRGSREVVIDNKTGFVVPPREPAALAKAVLQLMADDEMRFRFGKAGRQRVIEEFDETKVFNKILEVYQELLSLKPTGFSND
ncbi:MAG: hypothetical protein PWP72_399 [Thermoanaerobacter sp.]|nr:hypothetical protein [Thermoanaerobacter sp.]